MDVSPPLPDFSLMCGGPLYGVERRLRLVKPPQSLSGRRALAFMLLAWLPLPLLAGAWSHDALLALFGEVKVHTEMLVTLPVLIVAEPYVNRRIQDAVRQFLAVRLVGVGSRHLFEVHLRQAIRLRDSGLAEALILVAAYVIGFLATSEPARDWMFTTPGGHTPTPAGWWYLALSKPLLRFLMLRWFWRGLVWAGFLFRVSRLPLTLEPTHPDQMGGLGFLPICQASFAPVVFALAAAVAATVWESETHGIVGAPLPYLVPMLVLAVLSALAVCAPLGLFTPQLVRAKRRGDFRFSALAAAHARRFERKWFRTSPPAEKEILGAPEFSSLADLGTSFLLARKMRLFLFDTRALTGIVGAALAPLAVLLILDREFLTVLKQIREGLP
ncbi:hypothetical protein JY651_10780 [Pyxidicoccus parkwayensis]|uniref:Uncharacterized protein n=1 Tax=Pyxidicoccus parkwayensis TaxID=2813578 RepID=A0ABX7P4G0_9BACT|nr:hypothetical protein [Pyxidicoccus parkwaysis]QSQ25373.1 hypothetical protein JY651_10780 [Pyxidicoccus parkwaysis]